MAGYLWYAKRMRDKIYAARNALKSDPPTPKTILMHRQILDTDQDIDHKDGDGLNNRRENIRACTNAENMRNRKRHRTKAVGQFKGVFPRPSGRWQAAIRINSKLKCLGTFDTELEAADAYNEASVQLHGEFAKLNEF